jgi:hypothetical protein
MKKKKAKDRRESKIWANIEGIIKAQNGSKLEMPRMDPRS